VQAVEEEREGERGKDAERGGEKRKGGRRRGESEIEEHV